MTEIPFDRLIDAIADADVVLWQAPDGSTERLYARPAEHDTVVIEADDRRPEGYHLTAEEMFFEDGTVTPFAEEVLTSADTVVAADLELEQFVTLRDSGEAHPMIVTISADFFDGQLDRVMAAVRAVTGTDLDDLPDRHPRRQR